MRDDEHAFNQKIEPVFCKWTCALEILMGFALKEILRMGAVSNGNFRALQSQPRAEGKRPANPNVKNHTNGRYNPYSVCIWLQSLVRRPPTRLMLRRVNPFGFRICNRPRVLPSTLPTTRINAGASTSEHCESINGTGNIKYQMV